MEQAPAPIRLELPNALGRKYPNADKEWGWRWAFPATSHYRGGRGVQSPADRLGLGSA